VLEKERKKFLTTKCKQKEDCLFKKQKEEIIGSFFSSQSKKHYEISVELSHL